MRALLAVVALFLSGSVSAQTNNCGGVGQTACNVAVTSGGGGSVTQGTSPWVTSDNGTKITAATMPAVGVGVTGWLSAIWYALASPTLAFTASTSVSVATTSGTLATAGAYIKTLQVCTLPASTTNVWLNPTGAAAVVGAGIPVYLGGGCTFFGSGGLPLPTAAITAITDSGSAQTVVLAGG